MDLVTAAVSMVVSTTAVVGASGGGGCGHGGGRFSNFQCQVCYKYGHIAFVCHYWFDGNYQPNSSLVLHDPTS